MVEIRYSNGRMDISPEGFFKSRAKIATFRKLVKLSQESDLIYGTDAVNEWRRAIAEEQEHLKQSHETALFRHQNDVDLAKEKCKCADLQKEIERLSKCLKRTLSSIISKKKKLEKFYEIIERTKSE